MAAAAWTALKRYRSDIQGVASVYNFGGFRYWVGRLSERKRGKKEKKKRIIVVVVVFGFLTLTRIIKSVVTGQPPVLGLVWMDGGEKAGAKGQRGSDCYATRARPCWPTHTPDGVRRPPCEFLHRNMLKSTQEEDATS